MTTTSSPSVQAVPETIPAHTVTTDTAKVKVETSEFHYDAGVEVTVSTYSSEQGLGTALSEQHRTFASISLNLTPDECDELAAMLCAHAFDRRRVKDAKDAAWAARFPQAVQA